MRSRCRSLSVTPGQHGYTLVEVLVATVLIGILVTLGASGLRQYALGQALDGATDEVVAQLRQLQARVVSESHPLVYGARFRKGTPEYAMIVYDPRAISPTPQCTQDGGVRLLDTGSFGLPVRVSHSATSVPDSPEATICRASLPGITSDDVFVFFYARGTATPGTIRVEQPALGRWHDVALNGLTGRVERT